MSEFFEMTAAELSDAMRTGTLKSETLVRYYLARIEKYDQAAGLNAIAELDPTAVEQARILDAEGDRSSRFSEFPYF